MRLVVSSCSREVSTAFSADRELRTRLGNVARRTIHLRLSRRRNRDLVHLPPSVETGCVAVPAQPVPHQFCLRRRILPEIGIQRCARKRGFGQVCYILQVRQLLTLVEPVNSLTEYAPLSSSHRQIGTTRRRVMARCFGSSPRSLRSSPSRA
jgi:hypothetical protein